jgi:hypothetical protein
MENSCAPFQFLITPFLINDTQKLEDVFFGGRLPSFVFSILSIFLLIQLLYKFFDGNNYLLPLIYAVILFSFSYEFVVFSIQMESQAIVIFAMLILLKAHLVFLNDKQYENKKKSFLFGIICGLLLTMQYQLLFFIGASYLAIVYHILILKKLSKQIIINGLYSVFAFLLFFLPIYYLFLSKYTEHVAHMLAGGEKSAYYFPAHVYQGWRDFISYTFRFFFNNFTSVFRYMTMFFPVNTFLEKATFFINFLFFAIGSYSLLRDKSLHAKNYIIFSFISILNRQPCF